MYKRFGCLGTALLLSACGVKTTISGGDRPLIGNTTNDSSHSEQPHIPSTSYMEYHNGILGQINLNFRYNINTAIGDTLGRHTSINLPNVEAVMHPRFSSDDKVKDYLSQNSITLIEDSNNNSVTIETINQSTNESVSKLKAVIHTPAYESAILDSNVESIKKNYKDVLYLANQYNSVVVLPLWKDASQPKEISKRLYRILFMEAFNAAKANSNLEINLFATSKDQFDLMTEMWDILHSEFGFENKELAGHCVGRSHSILPALAKLAGSDAAQLSQGSFTTHGAATSVSGVRLMGVMSEGNVNQRQSTLMAGFPIGQHMIAVGTELGFEDRSFTYGITKVWGLLNVTDTFKLSAGIGATQEKIQSFNPFVSNNTVTTTFGAMMELGAHYSEKLSSTLNLSIDAGVRGLFSGSLTMGWFGLVSLDNGGYKTSAFVSSKDFGLSFGIEE
jgi:hypothetical protein